MVYDHYAGRLSDLDQLVIEAVPPGGNWRDLPRDFPSARVRQIRAGAAAGTGSRSTYYGRLHPERPAYTISTYFNRPGNGCFIHPEADRLITVREAARLQGFPDSFRFSGRGRSRFIQVGNAVPPLLAYHLARVLEGETAIDLFSGVGGLGLGFSWAGFQTLMAVDSEPSMVDTYNQNATDDGVATCADLSSPEALEEVLAEAKTRIGGGGLDALIGGPPCQGFSTAGKWLASDRRNDLVFAFVTAAERLRPRYVIMENVAALLWKRGRPFLDSVRQRLEAAGYLSAVALLHAESFGVPQLRRRLIVLASRKDAPAWPRPVNAACPPFFPDRQPGIDLRLPPPPGVLNAVGDLPIVAVDDLDDCADYARAPATVYQRWARGDIDVGDMVSNSEAPLTREQPPLAMSVR